jgi:hypothetical protein
MIDISMPERTAQAVRCQEPPVAQNLLNFDGSLVGCDGSWVVYGDASAQSAAHVYGGDRGGELAGISSIDRS